LIVRNHVTNVLIFQWSKGILTNLFQKSVKNKSNCNSLGIFTDYQKIYFVSDVPEDKQPVYFAITEITETGFTCENPQHEFPKKIMYRKEGNQLKAIISGDGKAFTLLF
jgi:hypothetical protein